MKLLERPTIDEYGQLTIAKFDGWNVVIADMLVNFRLLLVPESDPYCVAYGWCYPKGQAALLAVHVWNPYEQGEPVGHVRVLHNIPRQPGESAYPQTGVPL